MTGPVATRGSAKSLTSLALGRAIREMRARRGLSQEQLGAAVAIHRNYVGALERGELNPTLKVVVRVTSGLGLELSELIHMAEARYREFDPTGAFGQDLLR